MTGQIGGDIQRGQWETFKTLLYSHRTPLFSPDAIVAAADLLTVMTSRCKWK